MFTHHCTACDRTQLIFDSQIIAVGGSENDLSFTLKCWCGAEQVHRAESLLAL